MTGSGPEFYGLSMEQLLQRLAETRYEAEGWGRLMHMAITREIDTLVAARANGWDDNIQYRYDLTSDSIVWDVGAFDGDFAYEVNQRFGCHVRLFEVLPHKCAELKARFAGNSRIQVFPYGLSNHEGVVRLKDDGNATSIFTPGDLEVPLKRAGTVLEEDTRIDLMKINVEGAEFDILEDLLDTGRLESIRYFLIQFHDFVHTNMLHVGVPGAYARYEDIALRMGETHFMEWSFPWIWESWQRR